MSGELKIVLTCILLGAVGLTVGVITFSTLLPEIFGGRQGYVAGVVLVLLALAVLGLLQGAFECVLGDDLALPKHVAALGTLFVVVALNSAAVCVGANAMVAAKRKVSWAIFSASLRAGRGLAQYLCQVHCSFDGRRIASPWPAEAWIQAISPFSNRRDLDRD